MTTAIPANNDPPIQNVDFHSGCDDFTITPLVARTTLAPGRPPGASIARWRNRARSVALSLIGGGDRNQSRFVVDSVQPSRSAAQLRRKNAWASRGVLEKAAKA
jgi:hypothetical protein